MTRKQDVYNHSEHNAQAEIPNQGQIVTKIMFAYNILNWYKVLRSLLT